MSSQIGRRELRTSVNNLELKTDGEGDGAIRKSSSKIGGMTLSGKPDGKVDYFKHIQQKYQDKREQRKK